MPVTIRDVCRRALQRLMVEGSDGSMSEVDASVAFDILNELMDQWQSESLMLYANVRTLFTITPSTGTYAVGSGAVVNVPRPVYVDGVSYVDNTQSPPLEIPLLMLTDYAWDSINQKTLTSNLPINAYYNPTFPTGTLELWPIPTQASLQGVLYARTQVAKWTSLDDTVDLPNGWLRMMTTNLAVELGPIFEREPSNALVEQAAKSKGRLKVSNIRLVDLQTPREALVGNQQRTITYWQFLSGQI